MPDSRTYHFRLSKSMRASENVLNDPWYPGVQPYLLTCTTKRSVDPIAGAVAIVIHATAGSSSARVVSVMKKPTERASFHWPAPDEVESQQGQFFWACVPEALAACHARNAASHPDINNGEKRVNHWSLGAEVVNVQKNDPISTWQMEVTPRIVQYCWAKYPNLEHVVSHAKLDPTRMSDPSIEFGWARFKDLVLTSMPETVPELVAAATPMNRIRNGLASACCDT